MAYRGTDDKILSFYEDAELAYDFPIAVQIAALEYTKELMKKNKGKYVLGGHSKGGNLAIVKSSAAAVAQHNLFTWITKGYEFERADNFSTLSNYVEDSLTASLDTLSPEDLKKTVDAIYAIAKNSGLNTLDDINKNNYGNILLSIIQNVKSDDKTSRY